MTLLNYFKQKNLHTPSLPKHGGRLQTAIAESCLPANEWLDLSTGINPTPWPVPTLNETLFHRLPEGNQSLIAAAKQYYLPDVTAYHLGIAPLPGSQWFIQHFPRIAKGLVSNKPLNVLAPVLGYKEHAYWWQRYQHQVSYYQNEQLENTLAQPINTDIVVVINPNNPTTLLIENQKLLAAAQANPSTLFIIDEAFIDTRPAQSMLTLPLPDNVIVLRSLGKFFGLAGLRVGFCIANKAITDTISLELGPWPISTASEWIATQALLDSKWHHQTRNRLPTQAKALAGILECKLADHVESIDCCDYFVTLNLGCTANVVTLYQRLQQQGVLTRPVEKSPLLRVGLPANHQMQLLAERLQRAVLKTP